MQIGALRVKRLIACPRLDVLHVEHPCWEELIKGMKNRLAYLVASLALVIAAAVTGLTYTEPAEAQSSTVCVEIGGVVQQITVPRGGRPAPAAARRGPSARARRSSSSRSGRAGAPRRAPPPAPAPTPPRPRPSLAPARSRSAAVRRSRPSRRAEAQEKKKGKSKAEAEVEGGAEGRKNRKGKRKKATGGIRNPDGSPTPSNPGFVDALPGPSTASGVPNFVIRKFRVPVFLLPIYQAAGIQYGVRWEVLAAINEIETDYGRNLNVSSAGALGWMQFIPSSWRMYGVDANKDGKKDPYNPVDAIFAAARYLKAAGYEKDVRRSIFAYNHADWYVDSVMLRARLISGVPADLVGSLTGLTEGRFPVAARARYADDLQEKEATKRVKRGQNAANVVESKDDRENIEIFAKQGAPVVATNDGEIKKIGVSKKLGRYVTLQDVYGNRYTYSGLGAPRSTTRCPRRTRPIPSSPRAL